MFGDPIFSIIIADIMFYSMPLSLSLFAALCYIAVKKMVAATTDKMFLFDCCLPPDRVVGAFPGMEVTRLAAALITLGELGPWSVAAGMEGDWHLGTKS